jgi:hypothetical protein
LQAFKLTILISIFNRKAFLFFLFLTIFYHLVFNTYTAKLLSSRFLPSLILGQTQLEWERFSLLYGLEIKNLSIKGSGEFAEDTVLQCEEIRIRYNLPLLLLGRIKLSDIALVRPHLYLRERKGIWNISTVFVSADKPPESQEPQEKSSPLEEISTYLPISLFAKALIIKPEVRVQSETHEIQAYLKGPSLDLYLDTHRLRTIPLNLELLEKFETLHLTLGTEKEIFYQIQTPHLESESKMVLFLNLKKEFPNKAIYSSQMEFSGQSIPFNVKKKESLLLNFSLKYNINFHEPDEKLILDTMQLEFGSNRWIDAKGFISDIHSENPKFSLNFQPSAMSLSDVNSIYSKLPGLPFHRFGGKINIEKIDLSGDFQNIFTDINLHASDLIYQNSSSSHNVSKLLFVSSAGINLKKQKTVKPEIPYITRLKIAPLEINYNGAKANLVSEIESGKVSANLSLESFQISQFVKILSGRLSGKLKINGDDFNLINLDLGLQWPGFQILTPDFRTNPSNLNGKVSGGIRFSEEFKIQEILVQNLNLNLFNSSGRQALGLTTLGSIPSLSPFYLNLSKLKISVNLRNVLSVLQYSLMETVSPLRGVLGEEISLLADLKLNLEKGTSIQGNFQPKIDKLNIKDVTINSHIIMNADGFGSINIPLLNITGFSKTLKGSFNGLLRKTQTKGPLAGFFPDAKLDLSLNAEVPTPLSSGVLYKGNSKIKLSFNKSLVSGEMSSSKTDIKILAGNCPGIECKEFLIQQLQLNLPIEHDLNLGSNQSILSGDISRFVRTYGQDQVHNFSIHRVLGPHPFLEGQVLEFVKPEGTTPGFRGRMDYVRNVFSLNQLKINTLNGFIYGKNILFNTRSGLPQDMEYTATLQVRDMDLKELLHPRSARKIAEGKIVGDLNVSGSNLNNLIPNLDLYFSIYKIGKDFGKSAINIVMSSNYIQDYIVTSYSVDRIEIELARGLVYANILFKPGILPSLLTRIEDNKITQERMPLANFLNRAQSEITTYR